MGVQECGAGEVWECGAFPHSGGGLWWVVCAMIRGALCLVPHCMTNMNLRTCLWPHR